MGDDIVKPPTKRQQARDRYAREDATANMARCLLLLDRISEQSDIVTRETSAWRRYDPNIAAMRSGMTRTAKGRQAKGLVTTYTREYEIRAEVLAKDYGIPESDIIARSAARGDADEGAFDASFDPDNFDPEVTPLPEEPQPTRRTATPVPAPETEPAVTAKPASASRRGRDRFGWVATMQRLADQYKAGAK
jgi:hypothetical protein